MGVARAYRAPLRRYQASIKMTPCRWRTCRAAARIGVDTEIAPFLYNGKRLKRSNQRKPEGNALYALS